MEERVSMTGQAFHSVFWNTYMYTCLQQHKRPKFKDISLRADNKKFVYNSVIQ